MMCACMKKLSWTRPAVIMLLVMVVLWQPCNAARVKGARQQKQQQQQQQQQADELDNSNSLRKAMTDRRYQNYGDGAGTTIVSRGLQAGEEGGFLSSGFFTSYRDYQAGFRESPSSSSVESTTGKGKGGYQAVSSNNKPARPPVRGTRPGGYYSGIGHAFDGGFPIMCRPRTEQRMKGIVKRGMRKGGNGDEKYVYGGKGKGKGGDSKSSRSGKGKGKGLSRYSRSRRERNPGGPFTGGFLSRARFFNGVGGSGPLRGGERPKRRTTDYVTVPRNNILDMECYYGAFPPFLGIPDVIATDSPRGPTVAPSLAPSNAPSTAAPSIVQTVAPTRGATAAPTLTPTVPATATPTTTTAQPTSSTVQPTVQPTAATTTAIPTAATAQPTAATAAPSSATVAPSAATAAPTAATVAPSAPIGELANTTLVSLLNYGWFEDENVDRAPTEEEIAGLIANTIPFYAELFMTAYGDDFIAFDMTLNEATNDFERELPFQMDVDAIASFRSTLEPQPTPRDMFTVMQATDAQYQDYIRQFVWTAEPEGTIFASTMTVTFLAKDNTMI